MLLYLVILLVHEVDLVRVVLVRVGEEELVGGEAHVVQPLLLPLLLDPGRQPSGDRTGFRG